MLMLLPLDTCHRLPTRHPLFRTMGQLPTATRCRYLCPRPSAELDLRKMLEPR